ncbi:MAG: DUF934 domain-containing protein [Rhodoferax sp.]|uniref:DUF934 domain-containing protein n=1 Tax=Rhodoferax sp. TaxID=50421 RepID=UPI00260E38C3|nr:DUF934 domain-containing protein [Rhodoferax sp.]MDD2879325.1 DUF934 domain-containing protein [Rhodoferax sp.]
MKLIAADAYSAGATSQQALNIPNDADPRELALNGVERIDLDFPKFTDGRAFSQAYLLRRRLGFTGDIRATGDVLVDQLLQMQRNGFSSAVLRADQSLAHAQRQLTQFDHFYQGDAAQPAPLFAGAPAAAALAQPHTGAPT